MKTFDKHLATLQYVCLLTKRKLLETHKSITTTNDFTFVVFFRIKANQVNILKENGNKLILHCSAG